MGVLDYTTVTPPGFPEGYNVENVPGGGYFEYEGNWYWRDPVNGTGGPKYYVFDSLEELKNFPKFKKDNVSIGTVNDYDDLFPKITIGPIGSGEQTGVTGKTLRYPKDAIHSSTDYVFFQFGKYIPPFSKQNTTIARAGEEGRVYAFGRKSYNASTALKVEEYEGSDSIMLPMPQDLGNDLQQTWAGKEFSAIGRAAIAGAAGGDLSTIGNRIRDVSGNMNAIVKSLHTSLLNKLPGVGGNFNIGDITGSTQGIVLNPNAEVLYESPELREIGMSFKLVPRNADEAQLIKKIIQMFRYASVPNWGTQDGTVGQPAVQTGDQNSTVEFGNDAKGLTGKTYQAFGSENCIRVPWLCKFTFMNGSNPNRKLQQFKPCAIKRVAVNYTSDGTYATYSDGTPVSTELTLNFLESKALFKDDIQAGF